MMNIGILLKGAINIDTGYLFTHSPIATFNNDHIFKNYPYVKTDN